MRIDELIPLALADVEACEDLVRWAYTDAWSPGNAEPEPRAPRPASDEEPEGEPAPRRRTPKTSAKYDYETVYYPRNESMPEYLVNLGAIDKGNGTAVIQKPRAEDKVPGARWDLGTGSHAARQALQVAIGQIGAAERYAGLALYLTDGRKMRMSKVRGTSSPRTILAALAHIRVALGALTGLTILPKVVECVRRVAKHLDKAWKELSALFNVGGADPGTQAVGERCRNSERGCPGTREKGCGGRCVTCNNFFRNHQYEKPEAQFPRDHAQGVAAQARRRQRGEGYGNG